MSSKSNSGSESESDEICEVERIVGKRIGYGEVKKKNSTPFLTSFDRFFSFDFFFHCSFCQLGPISN